jgi:hypothetical protein
VDSGAPEAPDAGPLPPTYLQIRFDYRFDSYEWLTDEHKAVLEEAAAVWGRVLHDDFAPVPAGTELLTRDPENPDQPAVRAVMEEPIDDIVIFVGSAFVDGQGGTAALSFPTATLDVTGTDLAAELATRYDDADFEPWTGWISFDIGERWFVDPSPRTGGDLPADRLDFLSTATHEIGHVLGFGSAPAFRALMDGDDFVGAAAQEEHGGPVPLVDNGNHFPDSTLVAGERTLMDVSDPVGERFAPSALDLAVLEDIGYEVAP